MLALAGEQLCVGHLCERLGSAQPLVSHHLKVLREAGLIDSERYRYWTYYRLRPAALDGLADQLWLLARNSPAATAASTTLVGVRWPPRCSTITPRAGPRALRWVRSRGPGQPRGRRGDGGVGIDLGKESPKPLTDEAVEAADAVITMGCGDACPTYPGKRYLDWELDDPAGKPVEQVRAIRDEIDRRVQALLAELVPA